MDTLTIFIVLIILLTSSVALWKYHFRMKNIVDVMTNVNGFESTYTHDSKLAPLASAVNNLFGRLHRYDIDNGWTLTDNTTEMTDLEFPYYGGSDSIYVNISDGKQISRSQLEVRHSPTNQNMGVISRIYSDVTMGDGKYIYAPISNLHLDCSKQSFVVYDTSNKTYFDDKFNTENKCIFRE